MCFGPGMMLGRRGVVTLYTVESFNDCCAPAAGENGEVIKFFSVEARESNSPWVGGPPDTLALRLCPVPWWWKFPDVGDRGFRKALDLFRVSLGEVGDCPKARERPPSFVGDRVVVRGGVIGSPIRNCGKNVVFPGLDGLPNAIGSIVWLEGIRER